MSLSLTQLAHDGTFDAVHVAYALLVPASGASLNTIVGEAKTIAQVLLAPGAGLSKRHRDFALAPPHDLVSAAVRGDWERAPSPGAFHQATLRWAVKNAVHITVWSAVYPHFADDIARCDIDAANNGARFLLRIETVAEKAAEWADIVRRWKRPAASVRFFGPVSAEAVQ
jgi:hypothetical protein